MEERKYLLTLESPEFKDVQDCIRSNTEKNHVQYVANVNGDIVGWADIIPHQRELLRHSGVLGIGVISAYRGTGFGSALLRRVIEHSWRYGLTQLELEVFADNESAVALYKKYGFDLEGTKRNARLLDGVYKDAHLMAQCRL